MKLQFTNMKQDIPAFRNLDWRHRQGAAAVLMGSEVNLDGRRKPLTCRVHGPSALPQHSRIQINDKGEQRLIGDCHSGKVNMIVHICVYFREINQYTRK